MKDFEHCGIFDFAWSRDLSMENLLVKKNFKMSP